MLDPKRFIIVALLAISLIFLVAEDDFENWADQQNQSFSDYKQAQDKAFAEFLEKEWKDFKLFKGEIFDETPKPVEMPVSEVKTMEKLPDTGIVEDVKIKAVVLEQEEAEEKHFIAFVEKVEDADIVLEYWGKPVRLKYIEKLTYKLKKPFDHKDIARFWREVSKTNEEIFLKQLGEYKKEMQLNDWGYCLLLNEIGKKISSNSKPITKLFVWYMLTKTGFDTKVGYNKDNLYLMISSNDKIYGVPYLTFNDKKFFIVSFGKKEKVTGSIFTYDGDYPNSDNNLELDLTESPRLKESIVKKDLHFKYSGKQYDLTIHYDQSTAKYLANYPTTKLDIYFRAPLSPKAYASLARELKPLLVGKSQAVAVNILLRFVQTAFAYKTDGEQFGREKSLFTDETLFYPYSDCEDRSILFAYLVRNMLGIEVIGLNYPGHITTAVRFDVYVKGDAVKYKGVRYLICDPTYVNANIGRSMPQLKGVRPKLIKI